MIPPDPIPYPPDPIGYLPNLIWYPPDPIWYPPHHPLLHAHLRHLCPTFLLVYC